MVEVCAAVVLDVADHVLPLFGSHFEVEVGFGEVGLGDFADFGAFVALKDDDVSVLGDLDAHGGVAHAAARFLIGLIAVEDFAYLLEPLYGRELWH